MWAQCPPEFAEYAAPEGAAPPRPEDDEPGLVRAELIVWARSSAHREEYDACPAWGKPEGEYDEWGARSVR